MLKISAARLSRIEGLADLQVEKQVRIPQLDIIVDYTRAALYGLQPQAVTEHLERLSNGRVVSKLVDGTRRFDVVMRLDDTRRTTQGLGDLLLETPYGWVPVRHIAEVREGDGPNQILRENSKRRAVVLANADGSANMTRLIADIRRELAAMPLPQGVFTSLEGTFQAQEEASRTIAALSLLSLATIFAILYSRYRSAILALIIMGSVPLALIGSVAALWITGQPLSVASMVGFITLTGIASRNGILKISHYINLALHEDMAFGRDLVIRGSLERMTPVLMTALAAGLALLPLMIEPGAPGKEVLYPVAITIFGGLFSATLLDAFLTPILFLRFGERPLVRLIESARASRAGRLGPSNPRLLTRTEMNHETRSRPLCCTAVRHDRFRTWPKQGAPWRHAGRRRRLSRRAGRQRTGRWPCTCMTRTTNRSMPRAAKPPASL